MRVACVVLAAALVAASVPAMAGTLFVARGAAAVDQGAVTFSGRDARYAVEARSGGAMLEVELSIDAVAAPRRLTAGARLREGQRFSIRLPSSGHGLGETITLKREGERVRVVVTRPTAVEAMREGPAAIIASAGPAETAATGATPR